MKEARDYEQRFIEPEQMCSVKASRLPHHHRLGPCDKFAIGKQSCKSLGDRAQDCNEENSGRDSVSYHRVDIYARHAVDQELDVPAWKSGLSQLLPNTRMPVCHTAVSETINAAEPKP